MAIHFWAIPIDFSQTNEINPIDSFHSTMAEVEEQFENFEEQPAAEEQFENYEEEAVDEGLVYATTAELPEIKLFGRWSCDDVHVSDMSLAVSCH